MLREALVLLERGWSVFPLRNKRAPHVDWKPYQQVRPSPEQLIQWWLEWPNALVGVALGRVSNLIRIDADSPKAFEQLVAMGGAEGAAHFLTPSGGHGYLFQYLDGLRTEVLWSGQGPHEELRVQSDGAYTVVPPSAGYRWMEDAAPPKVPTWLYDRTVARVLQDLVRELRPTLRVPERAEVKEALSYIPADDYDQWVQVGMALKSAGDEYLPVWIAWSRNSSKFAEGECERKWAGFADGGSGLTTRSIFYWAEQRGFSPPNKHEPITELGNARVLTRMADGCVRHSTVWDWVVWDGRRWATDGAEKLVVEMQKRVLEYRVTRAIDSVKRTLAAADDTDACKKRIAGKMRTISLIRKHEDEKRIRGARELAKSEPTISCDYRLFDSHPMLLNCWNGVVDLRTGELSPHDPSLNITQVAPTEYSDSAECPLWLKFLDEVFDSDAEFIGWIHKLLGYAITATVEEHTMPILHGTGRNGKSTLIRVLLHVLGPDYACTTPSGYLVKHQQQSHPTKLVVLYGKRLAVDMETEDGAKLDEEMVKRITGGDEIQARRMHEDFWTFRPTHKLFMCTNYEPKVRGSDVAIWSRLRLVPFKRTFEGAARDTSLAEKLCKEAPGILRWLVEGCLRWQSEGLGTTNQVQAATDTYKHEQDTVSGFIAERCEIVTGHRLRKGDATAAYKAYCQLNRIDMRSPRMFSAALRKLGVEDDETGKWYTNLKVL